MVDQANVIKNGLAEKALISLLSQCKENASLQNDKDIHMIINMGKKMGIKRDNIPRVIPLSRCKLSKPRDLGILLITKDPSTLYRETLTKDEHTSDLFKEIISVKNLRRRFRGNKLTQLYKDFDLVVADYRVHHLLPDVLGNRFYHGSKKLPYMIRMSKEVKLKRQQMAEKCDPIYVRAQLRSICKNTSYIPNDDNCLSVRVGHIQKHLIPEILQNIQDVVNFLTDRSKRPQGGVIKGGIVSIFVKTSNSTSLPIYQFTEPKENHESEDLSDIRL
ncbi:Utp30p [Saccharomyces cerevisiae x Saccharomyces kudriavzevii VIN7]|uniref:Utp30p n=1 Tax=Saccharomyces cerevisiae x Saccharomyces kudriavzevii (strain VIN7) TaxID=1095631 RepID=H0GXR4_SACCK|nr:Utp30p [Saccharomyces cerevisiae x Saccharomyces kudriavzevii VIN7]